MTWPVDGWVRVEHVKVLAVKSLLQKLWSLFVILRAPNAHCSR